MGWGWGSRLNSERWAGVAMATVARRVRIPASFMLLEVALELTLGWGEKKIEEEVRSEVRGGSRGGWGFMYRFCPRDSHLCPPSVCRTSLCGDLGLPLLSVQSPTCRPHELVNLSDHRMLHRLNPRQR